MENHSRHHEKPQAQIKRVGCRKRAGEKASRLHQQTETGKNSSSFQIWPNKPQASAGGSFFSDLTYLLCVCAHDRMLASTTAWSVRPQKGSWPAGANSNLGLLTVYRTSRTRVQVVGATYLVSYRQLSTRLKTCTRSVLHSSLTSC